jgi:AcrR family transcriptional regulator
MLKTKQLLIDSARKVFARVGVQQATMNDIAEESNKGRRTLYTYFKSKEEVYNAVVEQELDTLISILDAVLKSPLTPDQKIIEFIYIHLDTINDIVKNNGTLRADFFSDIKAMEEARRSTDLKEIEMLREILTAGVERGSFSIESIDTATLMIFYAVKGLESPYNRRHISGKMKSRKDHIAKFVLKGLR